MKTISNSDYDDLKRSLPLILSAIGNDTAKNIKVVNAARRLRLILKKLK